MTNPVRCVGCWRPAFQVRLLGIDLREKSGQQLYDALINDNAAGLKHVAKTLQQDHLAASVYYNSKITGSFTLDGINVTIQPVISRSGECVRYSQRGLSFPPTPTPTTTPTPTPTTNTNTNTPATTNTHATTNTTDTPIPTSTTSEREATTAPENENETWKVNVKRAVIELRDKEKQHEEELARIKKKIRLLEEALS